MAAGAEEDAYTQPGYGRRGMRLCGRARCDMIREAEPEDVDEECQATAVSGDILRQLPGSHAPMLSLSHHESFAFPGFPCELCHSMSR